MTISELKQCLLDRARMGLDLSPGDDICGEALSAIKALEVEVERLAKIEKIANLGYTGNYGFTEKTGDYSMTVWCLTKDELDVLMKKYNIDGPPQVKVKSK